jgi:N-acetylneuraminate lyase
MKGLIAATYTPLRENGALKTERVASYRAFLRQNGLAGAFVNGSTGDFVSLSTTERKELIEAWAEQRSEGFTLINHVGHTNLREARELAAHCAEKVDAISALAPFYFRLKRLEDLLSYCKEIASCAPDTPFYYYHIPVLSGADFQMADFLDLAHREIPTFAGIKYTQVNLPDYRRSLAFRGGKYRILFGVDEMLVDSLPLGASGWVGSTYNHLAPLYRELIARYGRGETESAHDLQRKAVTFVETLDGYCGFNGGGKSFMRWLGLDLGPVRFPHRALTTDQGEAAWLAFEELGLSPYLSQSPVPLNRPA